MACPARWGAVVLEVPEGREDELAAALALGGLGAQILPAAPGRSRLRIFHRSPEQARAALSFARSLLSATGLAEEIGGLRSEAVEDPGWVEAYQASLKPFGLGRRFTVYPSGRISEEEGPRSGIVLLPGRAFGTGEHSTTQLCVAQLERWVGRGTRWLDLGCGTGILSIVARALGASEVLALDRDPEAVEVAREVLRKNGVRGVEVRQGSLEDAGPGRRDGIVCNINASLATRSARALAAGLHPGGRLIVSGFLEDELPEVAQALGRAAFVEAARESQGGWAVVTARAS